MEPGPTTEADLRRVAVIPGDDASPEAVHAALDVLRAPDPPVEWVLLPDGEELARDHSRAESEELIRSTIDACDTVLFGATSGKTGGLAYLRWGKGAYATCATAPPPRVGMR